MKYLISAHSLLLSIIPCSRPLQKF